MKFRQEKDRDKKKMLPLSDSSYGQSWENGDYYMIKDNDIMFLLNYSQVMMLADTTSSRYLCLLTTDIYHHLGVTHLPEPDLLKKVYAWGDKILQERGNSGYNLIRMFESICTGIYAL